MSGAKATARATWLYKVLLRVYPRGFREAFGAQMTETFAEQHWHARRADGRAGTTRLWLRVLVDTAAVVVRERASASVRGVRIAVRSLARARSFTLLAVVTLALGIGAATTVFSAVNGVLIRKLPFPDPDRLALLYLEVRQRNMSKVGLSMADYLDLRAHDRAFARTAAFGSWARGLTLTGHGEPEQVAGTYATAEFFSILGVRPLHGRLFGAGDDAPGRPRTLVVSERFWRRHGAAPAMVGTTVQVNGVMHLVVGVVPASFGYPAPDVDAWAILPLDTPTRRGPFFLRVVGRLRDRQSIQTAEAQLRAVPIGIRTGASPDQTTVEFSVTGMQEDMVGEVRPMLLLLLGSVGVLLLIAVSNVANLQITRASARAADLATRVSVGATRWDLARQQLVEGLLLGLAGGMGGVLLTFGAMQWLRSVAPADLPRLESITVDSAVLAVAVLLSVLAGMLFGLAPLLTQSSRRLATPLNESGRSGTESAGRARVRKVLVVTQIGLSCVLLISSGLMVRSFAALLDVRTGFDSTDLLAVQIAPSGPRYADDDYTRTFFGELLARVRAIPGVRSATLSSIVPPGLGGFSENITLAGAEGTESPVVLHPIVEPSFFSTMGTPIREGRGFAETDTAQSPGVVVVSEAFARRHFRTESPVGKRLRVGGAERPDLPWLEIVGVAADVRFRALDAEIEPAFYRPHAQNTMRNAYLILRSAVPSASLRRAIRQQVAALDGTIPVPELTRLDELQHRAIAQPRFRTLLLATFAVVALFIAGVGLYGVVAHAVEQRRQEIGIRLALGAQPSMVRSAVLREGMALAAVGVCCGSAVALTLRSWIAGFLFGVPATDVATFALVAVVLGSTCAVASLVPARRATRGNPMTAMKA